MYEGGLIPILIGSFTMLSLSPAISAVHLRILPASSLSGHWI